MVEINPENSPLNFIELENNKSQLVVPEFGRSVASTIPEMYPHLMDEIISVMEMDSRPIKHLIVDHEPISVLPFENIVVVSNKQCGMSIAKISSPDGYIIIRSFSLVTPAYLNVILDSNKDITVY